MELLLESQKQELQETIKIPKDFEKTENDRYQNFLPVNHISM